MQQLKRIAAQLYSAWLGPSRRLPTIADACLACPPGSGGDAVLVMRTVFGWTFLYICRLLRLPMATI